MNQEERNIIPHSAHDEESNSPEKKHVRILKRVGIGVAVFFGIIALLLTIILLWATPERITSLSEKEAANYMKGDLHLHGLDYSIISSFPYLSVSLDSLTVVSNNLKGQDFSTREQLPADCDLLMQTGAVSIKLNLIKLIFGKIDLHQLIVDRLRLNLVSVNDTLSNYDIFPQIDSRDFKIPKFTVDTISITNPEPITFFSLQSGTSAAVGINEITLGNINGKGDDYNLHTSGKISASVNDIPLLSDLTFRLEGDCGFDFDPFKVKLTDFNVNLGIIKGILNLKLRVDSNPQIEQLSYDIQEFNPLDILIYLPQGIQSVPFLKNIKSTLVLNAGATIDTPYMLLSPDLPSLKVNFNVPSGTMTYQDPKGGCYSADRVNLAGDLYYNSHAPENSYLNISDMEITSGDMTMQGNANIADLFGKPQLKAEINLDAELDKGAGFLPNPNRYPVRGTINLTSEIEASLSSEIRGYVERLSGKGDIHLKNLRLDTHGNGEKKMTASIDKMDLELNGEYVPGNSHPAESLDITCTGSGISYNSGDSKANARSFNLTASLKNKNGPKFIPTGRIRPHNDSKSLKQIKHSPEYLTFTPVKALTDFLERYEGELTFSLAGGRFSTPAFPAYTSIPKLDIILSEKGVDLKRLEISNRSTRASISGSIGNIHSFLTSADPVRIPVKLNLHIDTININQLAGTYERGLLNTEGSIVSLTAPQPAMVSASDSIAMLIPRNIVADISADADETVYTNLHLKNLTSNLHLLEGDLTIDTLTLNSGFGNVYLKCGYKTADINKLNMNVSAGILDINLKNLFSNFPKILETAPEATNFHGVFSGRMSAEMDLFPSMYVNLPSLEGYADIKGWDLTLHQNKYIRRITRLMMIPDSANLNINGLNIKAQFHHNLLEIYPFDFNFDKYSLQLSGVNNFNGKLYYHVAVKESPLRLPFGINIEGHFRHPKLRTGGVEYKPSDAQKVTSDIMMVKKINLMRELKYYLRQFIHQAAMSDTIPS